MALWVDPGAALNEQEKADLLAIESLRESSAYELKEQGNDYVKMGKQHYADALNCYTRAINQKIASVSDNSIFYANRAHVNLLLGNNRRALNDAREAIKLSSSNSKAYYRGAKAAAALELYEEASELCQQGLRADPSNAPLTTLQANVEIQLKNKMERKNQISKAKNLVTALKTRKIKLGPHRYKEHCRGATPQLDSSNILHWPVLLLYGEFMTSDLLENVSELDDFQTHLDYMYEKSPVIPWDESQEYTRDRIELYYPSNLMSYSKKNLKMVLEEHDESSDEDDDEDGQEEQRTDAAESERQMKWVKVEEKWSLGSTISRGDYVIDGVPVFYVVSNGSSFRKQLLSGNWTPP